MQRKPTPLKRAIFDSGRHQQDIAAEVGVDPSTLSKIVNGLHCSDVMREKIANALGKTIDELWPGHDHESNGVAA